MNTEATTPKGRFSPIAKEFLISVCKRRRRSLALLFVLSLIGTFLELIGIGVIFPIILIKTNPAIVESHRLFRMASKTLGITEVNELIHWLIGLMVLAFFLRNLHLVYLTYIRSKMLSGWKEDMARDMMQAYLRAPYPYIIRKTPSVLIRNIEVTGVIFDRVVIPIIHIVTNLMLVLAIVVLIGFIKPMLTLIATVSLIVLIVLQNRFLKNALINTGELANESAMDMHQVLQQSLGVARESRLMSKTAFFVSHYVASHRRSAKAYCASQVFKILPPLMTQFVLVLIIGAVLLILMSFEDAASAFPTLGLMGMAAFRLAPRFNTIQLSLNVLHESNKPVERIAKEFHEITQITDKQNRKISVVNMQEEIRLDSVHFSYSGKKPWLLDGVNMTIESGDFVGLMGASGVGKSSLVDIVTGLLAPVEGAVYVDGTPLITPDTERLTRAGFVSQNPFFFSDSIKRNVALGVAAEDIDDAAVAKALKMAMLDDYVSSLPEGMDTFIGYNASMLSGGQRQRLAIARALYAAPNLLILDEPTSALDAETEDQIVSLLATLRGKLTIILITHRPAILVNCNKFFFLAGGVLEASDSLETLSDKNAAFEQMLSFSSGLQRVSG